MAPPSAVALPRVMHLLAGGAFGGGEMQCIDTAVALHEAGLPQHVILRANPLREERLQAAGISHETLPFGAFPPGWSRWRVARAARRFQPHIIQGWMGRAARLAPRPGVVSVGWFGGYHPLKRFRRCDWCVAITRDVERHIIAHGFPPDRVALLHQFSDITPAAPVDRAALGTPQGAPLLLALARLHPRKGLDVLLNALTDLPGVHLWIAGEGEERGALEDQIARLELGDRVRLLGWRTDRAALLAAADVFVLPSRHEPFGIVMLEAWALRVPVVAAASQGPRDYITDGRNGLLVPVDDAAALARRITEVLQDPSLRHHLTAHGRAGYEADFTRAAAVDHYLAFYRRLAGQEQPS